MKFQIGLTNQTKVSFVGLNVIDFTLMNKVYLDKAILPEREFDMDGYSQ